MIKLSQAIYFHRVQEWELTFESRADLIWSLLKEDILEIPDGLMPEDFNLDLDSMDEAEPLIGYWADILSDKTDEELANLWIAEMKNYISLRDYGIKVHDDSFLTENGDIVLVESSNES